MNLRPTRGWFSAGGLAILAIVSGGASPLVGSTSTTAVTATSQRSAESDADLAFNEAQRGRLGLDADSAYVTSVDRANLADPDWGIPLTAAEKVDLSLNATAQDSVAPITADLNALGVFGGIWLTSNPTAIHVATTRALTTTELAAIQDLSPAVTVTPTTRSYSYSQLLDVTHTLSTSSYWTDGYLVAAGPDMMTGQVDVGVSAGAPSSVSAALRAQYGDEVVIELNQAMAHATAGRSFSSGTVAGGEWITGNGEACTSSYNHFRNPEGEGGYYGVTAGHCSPSGATIFRGHQNNTNPLGSMGSGNPVYEGATTDCDCKQYGTLNSQTEVSNDILGSSNQRERMVASSGSAVGADICMSGARTFDVNQKNACGQITDLNKSQEIFVDAMGSNPAFRFQLTNSDYMTIIPQPGDSGGPIYSPSNHKLYGITSAAKAPVAGGGVNGGIYSEILNIKTAGVTVSYG